MRAEFEAKLERVRQFMAAEGLGTLVMSRLDNVAWLTCGARAHVAVTSDIAAAALVVTEHSVHVVANCIEAPRLADEELAGLPVSIEPYDWHDGSADEVIARLVSPTGRVGADVAAPGRELVTIQPLRYALLPIEQDAYRALGADLGAAIGEVARQLHPGETEHQIAGRLTASLFRRGIWPQLILVAADDRMRLYRHPLPTDRLLRERVMLVCGGRRRGLVASVTRIVSFGEPDDELRRRHQAVCRVDATLIAHTVPGASVAAVFAAGVAAYAEEGFPDEWRQHHQGGAAGYLSREYRGSLGCAERIREGQAFAWNPSIAGTKSEDTILAGADGPEILTASPDWPLLDCTVGGRRLARADILVR